MNTMQVNAVDLMLIIISLLLNGVAEAHEWKILLEFQLSDAILR